MCFAQGTALELPRKAGSVVPSVALSACSGITDPVSKGFPVAGSVQWRDGPKMCFKRGLSYLVITNIIAERNSPGGGLWLCLARSWLLPRMENSM